MIPTSRGFTLIELMATMAVAVILLTVAVPGFQELIAGNRMGSNSHRLLSAFNGARRAAVDFASTATICTSDDGQNCCDAEDDGACDWAQGWIVFADRNGNGVPDLEEIVSVTGALPSSLQIAGNDSSDNQITQVAYTPIGVLATPALLTFDLCDSGRSGEVGRQITINAGGRARATTLDCS